MADTFNAVFFCFTLAAASIFVPAVVAARAAPPVALSAVHAAHLVAALAAALAVALAVAPAVALAVASDTQFSCDDFHASGTEGDICHC